MFSYFEANFIEKFLWKVFFQILAQVEMTKKKSFFFFGCHYEKVQHFDLCFVLFFILFYFALFVCLFVVAFSRILIFYSPYMYGANFIAKFRCKSGFLSGFHGPPPGTNGSKSTLVT